MKSSRLLLLSVLVFVAAFSSCKKDKDDSKEYLKGGIVVPVDKYVEAGYTKTFCVDTLLHVSRSDGGGIGYFHTLPNSVVRDTIKTEDGTFKTKTFTIEAPDSLDTFSFVLGAFAKGYYETTGSGVIVVVKPGLDGKGSLTGYNIGEDDPSYTDERDGNSYYFAEGGGLQWMKSNLIWDGAGTSFEKCTSPAVSAVFGRYYTWEEAQTACPEGWRLPSDKDWVALAGEYVSEAEEGKDIPGFAGHLMENIYFNGARMWEYWRDVAIDNTTGFCAAPFGYALLGDGNGKFTGLDRYAVFWTSSEEDDMGVYRYIFAEKDNLYYGTADKQSFAASVRCVRDLPDAPAENSDPDADPAK